jgi:protein TonB
MQQRLLDEMRAQRNAAATTGEKEQSRDSEDLDTRARELEERIAAQVADKAYFTPSTLMTVDMAVYYKRLNLKLEDCGMRHFPQRGKQSVYGKGVVSIELDQAGNAVATKIEQPSSDPLIDNHILRLVAASTPFGPTPERVRPDDDRRYARLVVITTFTFTRDDKPATAIAASQRCTW